METVRLTVRARVVRTNLLNGRGNNLEVCRNITAKYTGLQRLHMTTDVCFRCHEVTFKHSSVSFLVSVRHDHISPVGFDLGFLINTARNEGGSDEP